MIGIHVATLIEGRAPMRSDLACVEVIRGVGGPIALAQRRRGISFVVDERYAESHQLDGPLARFVRRAFPANEVVFGPERLVRDVLAAARSKGLAPVEFRRQEFLRATPRVYARASPVVVPQRGAGGEAARGQFVLRAARVEDLAWLLDAHGEMCREDLGIDQVAMHRSAYRNYFIELIAHGRSHVGEIDGERVFKLEVPLSTNGAWLIEGVYTVGDRRGQGLATWAVSRVARDAAREGRVACLYVHLRNTDARRLYRKIGFVPESPWITALIGRSDRARRAPREI